ncbi:MAG: hypothetical protein JO153_04545 [Solirubrobacterales bacterium]|nr:hypothetical protein [Solirubrobacterales bacterium]
MPLASLLTLRIELPAHFLDDRGRRAGFVLIGAFLASFLFIRTSARLIRSPKVPWWPGSVKTASGLHLHHLVWGILLLMGSGFLGFITDPSSPRTEILAAVFGIGLGLTLDEFALWIHLRDVYWADEGRASFDAVVVAATIGGLIVLGAGPFDLHHNSSIDTLITVVLTDVILAMLAIFKGKRLLGLIGLFVVPVSLVGAMRLAAPDSPWARRFYDPSGRKLARSRARWERITARRRRISDAIAGAPEVAAGGEPPASAADAPPEALRESER